MGDLGPLSELAAEGRGFEGAEAEPLAMLSAFLDGAPADYAELAVEAAGSVRFAGRLEHDEVAVPVACADALVFPSTFPEAFGMVAAEAAATGALPISAAHSGAVEVSRELAAGLAPQVAALLSFALDDVAVVAIASRLAEWLGADPADRAAVGEQLRETVERLWSWEGVARTVLDAAAGRLEDLPRPGEV